MEAAMPRTIFRFHIPCALISALAACAAAQAQTDALDLGEALRLAAARSQSLVAQDAAADGARELAVAAGERPDPTLTAGLTNLPLDGPNKFSVSRDFMTMRSIGLMREFPRQDKRDMRSARFEREAEAAEAARALALARLERSTAVAWLDRYFQERLHAVLVAQRDEARVHVDAADTAYRAGRGSQSDVFAARSAIVQIEDRIAAADRDVEVAKIQLTRWIGTAASRPLGERPATDTVAVAVEDLEADIAHHPMLAVMARQEEVARAAADIARADKRPDWSVELMYGQRGSAFSNMVSVNVSRPLQWRQRNRQERELAAKLAVVAQIQAEREEETRAHLADAESLLYAWQSNRDRLLRYDAALIPLARERTLAATAAYRGRSGPLTAVLDARNGEIEVRRDQLILEMETAELWAELNYLVLAGHGQAAAE
jgi:outer membrane protein TolC